MTEEETSTRATGGYSDHVTDFDALTPAGIADRAV